MKEFVSHRVRFEFRMSNLEFGERQRIQEPGVRRQNFGFRIANFGRIREAEFPGWVGWGTQRDRQERGFSWQQAGDRISDFGLSERQEIQES